MKSEFFSMFGIPPTECEIEARKDELGVPRLWFRSTGNPLVGLDLTGATQLQHLLTDAGEANQANEKRLSGRSRNRVLKRTRRRRK
jgi:hypothetical protein